MASLVGELHHLVLYRWTITWSNAFNSTRVEGGLFNVSSNHIVQCRCRVTDVTLYLVHLQRVGAEGKRHGSLVTRLRLKGRPINCSSVESRRSPGLQSTYRKS